MVYCPVFRLISQFCLLISIALLSLLPMKAHSQYPKIMASKEGKHLNVPFTYINGFIVIDVILHNALPLKFIVDTGASHTLLLRKEYIQLFNLKPQRKLTVQGADLVEYMSASIYHNIYLKVSNMPPIPHNIIVLDEDYTQFEALTGMHIAGILGADFFRNMILGIDFIKNQLTLYNSHEFFPKKLKKYHEFDIELVNNKPYLKSIVEIVPHKKIETQLLIDSGASLGILLHQNTDSLISIPSKNIQSVLGKGLGGNILGYTGRIHKLDLNHLHFDNIIANFQSIDTALVDLKKIKRNGIIGSHLLERFHVIIDFRWRKMYLKPIKKYNQNIEYDKSGLSIVTYGPKLNEFLVRYVVEGSPAELANIQAGDIIIKLGWLSSWRYSLDGFLKKLSGKEGKKLKFTIVRDGQKLEKTLVLKKYI